MLKVEVECVVRGAQLISKLRKELEAAEAALRDAEEKAAPRCNAQEAATEGRGGSKAEPIVISSEGGSNAEPIEIVSEGGSKTEPIEIVSEVSEADPIEILSEGRKGEAVVKAGRRVEACQKKLTRLHPAARQGYQTAELLLNAARHKVLEALPHYTVVSSLASGAALGTSDGTPSLDTSSGAALGTDGPLESPGDGKVEAKGSSQDGARSLNEEQGPPDLNTHRDGSEDISHCESGVPDDSTGEPKKKRGRYQKVGLGVVSSGGAVGRASRAAKRDSQGQTDGAPGEHKEQEAVSVMEVLRSAVQRLVEAVESELLREPSGQEKEGKGAKAWVLGFRSRQMLVRLCNQCSVLVGGKVLKLEKNQEDQGRPKTQSDLWLLSAGSAR